jgi:hypothetical protein
VDSPHGHGKRCTYTGLILRVTKGNLRALREFNPATEKTEEFNKLLGYDTEVECGRAYTNCDDVFQIETNDCRIELLGCEDGIISPTMEGETNGGKWICGGMYVRVHGIETDAGIRVESIVFPTPRYPPAITIQAPLIAQPPKVLFLFGSLVDRSKCNGLIEFTSIHKFESIIVTGNALSDCRQGSVVKLLEHINSFLSLLSNNAHVYIMTGIKDPSSSMLPLPPLGRILLPCSTGNPRVTLCGDPNTFTFNEHTFFGVSGVTINDLIKHRPASYKKPETLEEYFEESVDAMWTTLACGHLAPSTPDTLMCTPFTEHEPFVIEGSWPHVYVAGGQKCTHAERVQRGSSPPITFVTLQDFSEHGMCVSMELTAEMVTSLITIPSLTPLPDEPDEPDELVEEDSSEEDDDRM